MAISGDGVDDGPIPSFKSDVFPIVGINYARVAPRIEVESINDLVLFEIKGEALDPA